MKVSARFFRSFTCLLLVTGLCSVMPGEADAQAGAQARDLAAFQAAKRHFRAGMEYFNNMQYLAAAEFFRKALKELPDYGTAREYLARSLKLAGYPDAALKEWEILAQSTQNSVAVAAKIESLRFRDTSPQSSFAFRNLVLFDTYRAFNFKRFGFLKPADLVVDSEKNLYITSFSTGKLIKIDANGKPSDVFQPSLSGKLFGIDCYKNRLAVSDFAGDTVYFLDTGGKKLGQFGGTGSAEGRFHGPEGVCFDSRGQVYVVDSGNHRVQKFSANGGFILNFGEKGEYEGQLQNPTDVTVIKNRVYVTDSGNRRVACFDDSGNFVENLSIEGLRSPRGITSMQGKLLVSDEKKGLCFFDRESGETGWFDSWGKDNKGFTRLLSAAVDREGYLYCLDYNNQSVFLFSPVQKRYSNLEIEITSVDTKKFPVVAFYVNIRSRDGSPVYGLDRSNFRLTEDQAPIDGFYINYFKSKQPSVSLALCVDRSEENRENHSEIPWVSDFLFQKMRKNDTLKVINFNSESWQGSPFDWSRRRAQKALSMQEYGKGKNMGLALYGALSDLAGRINRRGVVLVTDGSVREDSFLTYDARTIVSYARNHYIPIYIISFKKPDPVLRQIAEESGGAIFRASEMDGLRGIYDAVKKSEEYRYVLVYSTFKPASFKGWWSEVKIEAQHKGQKGVEWGGYFCP